MKEVKNIPFDLYGDLWDAYEEAEGNGDVEVVETLDTFGIWNEHPKCDRTWRRRRTWGTPFTGPSTIPRRLGRNTSGWTSRCLQSTGTILRRKRDTPRPRATSHVCIVPICFRTASSRSDALRVVGGKRQRPRNIRWECVALRIASGAPGAERNAVASRISPVPMRLKPRPIQLRMANNESRTPFRNLGIAPRRGIW